jgi:hypothetical protein
MHNALWMHADQGLQDASHDNWSVLLVILSIFLNTLEELSTVEILQYQVYVVLWFKNFIQVNDIFMIKFSEQSYLLQ